MPRKLNSTGVNIALSGVNIVLSAIHELAEAENLHVSKNKVTVILTVHFYSPHIVLKLMGFKIPKYISQIPTGITFKQLVYLSHMIFSFISPSILTAKEKEMLIFEIEEYFLEYFQFVGLLEGN